MRNRVIPLAIFIAVILIAGGFIVKQYRWSWPRVNAATLNVPFTPQAPAGNWSEPWQNACEETSIIIVDHYYRDEPLDRQKAEAAILKIITEKEKRFGKSTDESMETVASLINEGDFSWRARVIENPTLEQIKNEIINGRPVIVPVYAMALTNPVYESGAVDYHTVVVIGYDDSRKVFITHDPGTSRGEKFAYQYQEFYDAIHDLNESNYTDGPRRAVFTERK